MKDTSRIPVALDSSRSSPAFKHTLARGILTLVATAMLVLAFSLLATAQTGAVLSGVVHDRAGEPVSGVILTIVDPVEGDTAVDIAVAPPRSGFVRVLLFPLRVFSFGVIE